jgi:hypothetical protein
MQPKMKKKKKKGCNKDYYGMLVSDLKQSISFKITSFFYKEMNMLFISVFLGGNFVL